MPPSSLKHGLRQFISVPFISLSASHCGLMCLILCYPFALSTSTRSGQAPFTPEQPVPPYCELLSRGCPACPGLSMSHVHSRGSEDLAHFVSSSHSPPDVLVIGTSHFSEETLPQGLVLYPNLAHWARLDTAPQQRTSSINAAERLHR